MTIPLTLVVRLVLLPEVMEPEAEMEEMRPAMGQSGLLLEELEAVPGKGRLLLVLVVQMERAENVLSLMPILGRRQRRWRLILRLGTLRQCLLTRVRCQLA